MPFMQSKQPKEYPTTKEVQELLKTAATVEGGPAREVGRILLKSPFRKKYRLRPQVDIG